MEYRLVTTPEALEDLLGISAYIAQDSPKRAYSFVEELKMRMSNLLGSFPNTGRKFGSMRILNFGNYVILYRVDEPAKTVTVLLVTEGHRDWQDLLDDRL